MDNMQLSFDEELNKKQDELNKKEDEIVLEKKTGEDLDRSLLKPQRRLRKPQRRLL